MFDQLNARDKRALLFHLLYAAESHEYALSTQALIDMLNRGFNLDIPFESELAQTADAIIASRDKLDETYKPFLTNWRFDRLGVPTKLILRYAFWELLNTDTAPFVVINEAIELAKCFAEKDAYKFINGLLDEALKKSPLFAHRMNEADSKE